MPSEPPQVAQREDRSHSDLLTQQTCCVRRSESYYMAPPVLRRARPRQRPHNPCAPSGATPYSPYNVFLFPTAFPPWSTGRKHGLSTESVPVSAYIECWKNLEDLNSLQRFPFPNSIPSVEHREEAWSFYRISSGVRLY
jgi:hypothetical protein